MPSRRHFLKTVPLGIAALSAPSLIPSCKPTTAERPNVILIMTDDQGYGDFGVTGNPVIKTPNLDRLAAESAQMTQFYVSPVCSPTRACLMTGRYNYRTGVVDTWIGRSMMNPEEVTLAEAMSSAGYATGIFGKWHLGDNYPMRPQDQGFDEVLMHRGGGIGQPADPPEGEGKYTDPVLFHNGEKVHETGYCTDVYFERGMEWMDRVHEKGQNFFMYIATNAPHGPFHDVPESLYEEYKKMDLENSQFPQQEGHPLPEEADTDKRARIYAMITNVDENIGKLMVRLEKSGLADNTIIIFLVDNGPNGQRYVAGMRGSKSSVYEGGIRSPFFIRWPARFKPGMKDDHVAAHIDIMPTILDACHIPSPEGVKMDGRSLVPLLDPQVTGSWSDRSIVIQSHRGDAPVKYNNFALRNQRWKFLHASGFGAENFEGNPDFELYDMVNDPLETKNVIGQYPGVAEKLKTEYERWFDDVSSTRPDNYAPQRIIVGTRHENPVVLTRQDWRSETGGWGQDQARGTWLLRVAATGLYNIRVIFRNVAEGGPVNLFLNERRIQKKVLPPENEVTFENVELEKGHLDLEAVLDLSEVSFGPWHIHVEKL